MKKLFTLLAIISITISILGQVPQKMSYQCVVRNSSGGLVTNQSVGIRISILQATTTGTVVYQETYNPNPQTNANGLLSIEIGGGLPIIGTFSTINWGSGPYFLKTETDPSGGTNYEIVGTSQLLSVPYAMYSRTAGNGFSGNYSDLTNRPLLFDGTWAAITGKPTTISGYGILDAVMTTGNQTIGGIKTFTKDLSVNGLTVGRGSGAISNNAAFGNQSLFSNTTGDNNTAIGTQGLFSNSTGNNNTATGYAALYYNTTGYDNSANGYAALYTNTSGYQNTATGRDALGYNSTGRQNTATGYRANLNNTEGRGNTANGYQAGYTNTKGNNNVFLGYEAGYFESGSNKLFIDNQRRSDESDARTKSLIYGIFDPNPANQVLTINGNVNVSNNKITNAANPVNAQDVATKDYVDAMMTQITMLKNTLKAGGIVTDMDGNTYNTVVIGTQTWMAENLRTTKYNDGTNIPLTTDPSTWNNLTTPGYCWYNNDATKFKSSYGALYNWYSVNTGKLCPAGWHVPTFDEWGILWRPFKVWDFVNQTYGIIGNELMESGTTHWVESLGTNETGFTALPGGDRFGNGTYSNMGEFAFFWCSDYWSTLQGTSYYQLLPAWEYTNSPGMVSLNRVYGLSVRCLKN
jgi:uncharacterized protein (TIGR02145 family)